MISKKPMTQTIPSTIYFDKRLNDFEASSDNFASLLSSSKIAAAGQHKPATNRINYQLDSKSINYFGYNLNPNPSGANGSSSGHSKGKKLTAVAGKSSRHLNLLANNSTASFTSLLAGSSREPKNGKSNPNQLSSHSQFFKPDPLGFEQESFIIAKHQHPPPNKTFQKYAIERQINHFMNNKEGVFRPKSSNKTNSKYMVSKMLSGDLENENTKSVVNLLNSNSHGNFNSTSTISIGSNESKLGGSSAQPNQQNKSSKSSKNVS
jgi:hypothetical protein